MWIDEPEQIGIAGGCAHGDRPPVSSHRSGRQRQGREHGRPARRRVCARAGDGQGLPVTAYLKNGGTLENAAAMANHASTRTTQLYDRRCDEISLDEVERVRLEP
jgi:hypothetical protein